MAAADKDIAVAVQKARNGVMKLARRLIALLGMEHRCLDANGVEHRIRNRRSRR